MKKLKVFIIIFIIIIISIASVLIYFDQTTDIKTIKSENELLLCSKGFNYRITDYIGGISAMPSYLMFNIMNGFIGDNGVIVESNSTSGSALSPGSFADISADTSSVDSTNSILKSESSTKDYSTTNIQVENVDEADITKTDGDYIYSISENNVIITNAMDPNNIKLSAKIQSGDNIPEDLILYKNKLVVIYEEFSSTSTNSYYSSTKANTIVEVYDIENKEKPVLVKEYKLYEPYYTSRCIDNMLYIISSGDLRKEDDKVLRNYKEDNVEKEIDLNNIKYLRDVNTTDQTLIASMDLDNVKSKINVSSYLINISNAYVSESNIYLLNSTYRTSRTIPFSEIFGLSGLIGFYSNHSLDYSQKTQIFKFAINSDSGLIDYETKANIDGKTIDQYSLDEKDEHLRIALYNSDKGTKISIFDEKLDLIGESDYVANGERMYSSRFMGDKAYLVTYKTVDPLFVFDLSDESKPKVLGALKIPGYSTYLHPYDETHIIGIGMETKENIRKNANGKVVSTSSTIVGMKMALFDVSDFSNPKQISQTVIGDSRTTSAILTNPKALLFSKEKELLAIPVNNYSEDFSIDSSSDTYSSIVSSYNNYRGSRVGEGYFVYKINLTEGFKLKGVITHDVVNKDSANYYSSLYSSKMLRGLYIDDNLFTVSETAVKAHSLDSLKLLSELILIKK